MVANSYSTHVKLTSDDSFHPFSSSHGLQAHPYQSSKVHAYIIDKVSNKVSKKCSTFKHPYANQSKRVMYTYTAQYLYSATDNITLLIDKK